MSWFTRELKVILKPHVIKGKLLTVYFNNGDILSELIKDEVKFYDYNNCNILISECDSNIGYRINGLDSVTLVGENNDIIIIPKTSILKIFKGPEQTFETVEVFSHLE